MLYTTRIRVRRAIYIWLTNQLVVAGGNQATGSHRIISRIGMRNLHGKPQKKKNTNHQENELIAGTAHLDNWVIFAAFQNYAFTAFFLFLLPGSAVKSANRARPSIA